MSPILENGLPVLCMDPSLRSFFLWSSHYPCPSLSHFVQKCGKIGGEVNESTTTCLQINRIKINKFILFVEQAQHTLLKTLNTETV